MRYVIFLSIMLFIAGCSVKTPKPTKNISYEQNYKKREYLLLLERFIQYWQNRVDGKIEDAWKYELPYQKYVTGFKQYKSLIGSYKGYHIQLIEIKQVAPNVVIVTRKVYKTDPNNATTKYDKWIKIDNTWYHKFYQNVFPPKSIEEFAFQ